jgi:hypothetical protein
LAAVDTHTRLMREHPVGVQAKMVMAFAPGRGDRIGLLDHDRVNTSPADRPGRRQAGRASADDRDMFIRHPHDR